MVIYYRRLLGLIKANILTLTYKSRIGAFTQNARLMRAFWNKHIKINRTIQIGRERRAVWFGLVYWRLTPQSGSYQGGEMMMKSVFWWRKPEYPEETTDLRGVTDETFHTYGLCPVRGLNLGRSGVKQSELRRDARDTFLELNLL